MSNPRRALAAFVFLTVLSTVSTWGSPPGTLPEVENLEFVNPWQLEWDVVAGASAYNVYRGKLEAIDATWGTCFTPNVPTNSSEDLTADPSPGEVYFYLITAASHQTPEGTKGFEDFTPGERANPSPCSQLPPAQVLLDTIITRDPSPDGVERGVNAPRNPGIANDLTGLAGGGVYLHTGEYLIEEVDLEIPGRGIGWCHVRYYRSQIRHDGQQGFNWSWNYDRRLLIDIDGFWHLDGTGRRDLYVYTGPGLLYEPEDPGIYNKLRMNPDNSFTLRERDGTLYHYSQVGPAPLDGRLTRIEDRLGNTLTFNYEPSGILLFVVDTLGRTIDYYWNGEGRLQSVVDPTGREVRYEYDLEGNLVSVRTPRVTDTSTGNDFPDGKMTHYGYDPSPDFWLGHNLLTITAPGDPHPVILNTYNAEDELLTQCYGDTPTCGDGAGGLYQYSIATSTPGPGQRQTTVTDRRGISHVFVSDTEGHVTEERVLTLATPIRPGDPASFVTLHAYNLTGERTSTGYPAGNAVLYAYDQGNPDRFQRGNLLSITRVADLGRGDGFGGTLIGPMPDIQVSYAYEPLYNQQRTIAGPRTLTCSGSGLTCGGDGDCDAATGEICIQPDEYVYDYQEGVPADNRVLDLQTDWAIHLDGIPLSLGDQNGDAIVEQNLGNPIVLTQRSNLLPGGRQATLEGGTIQPVETRYRYNALGQIEVEIDPENNVKLHEYYPEIEPDGDGLTTDGPYDGRGRCSTGQQVCFFDGDCSTGDTCDPGLDPSTGGYLRSMTLDAVPGPYLTGDEITRRDNGTNPTPAEIVNTYSYDPVGNLISSMDGEDVLTVYEVNPLGQIVTVRRGVCALPPCGDPDLPEEGFLAEQFYNERDEIVTRTVQDFGDLSETGGSIEINMIYDILGNVTEMLREVGAGIYATTGYGYDAQENRTSITFPEGNEHTLEFDERNLLYRLTRGAGSPDASVQVFNYDLNGNPAEFVDGNDTSWLMIYDGFDRRVAAEIDPGDVVDPQKWYFATIWNRDESIAELRVIDSLDLTTATTLYESRFTYDALGRVLAVSEAILDSGGNFILGEDADANGYVDFHKEYDRNGRLTRSYPDDVYLAPVSPHFEEIDHHGAGRMIHKTDALGNEIVFEYDKNNNVTGTIETEIGVGDPEIFNTVNAYDRLNRLISTTDNAGQEKLLTYDSRDNLIELEDALDNITRYTYDGLDRRIGIRRDPEGLDIPYTTVYDLNGRAGTMIDPNGNPTQCEYDSLGRKIRDLFVDGTTNEYVYDGNDNVVQLTDGSGVVIDITYDVANRPTERVSNTAAYVRSANHRFEYDPLSRLTYAFEYTSRTPFPEVSRDYDSLNRVRSETTNLGSWGPERTLSYTYDGNGNRATASYPSGVLLSYSYDPLNRLINVLDTSGATAFSVDYDYFGPERIDTRTNGDNSRTWYEYDSLERRTRIQHVGPDGFGLGDFRYDYDPVGNILEETRNHDNASDIYQYDNAYRLVQFQGDVTIDYTLDKVGNWLERVINGVPYGNTPSNLNEYSEKPDDGIPDDFHDRVGTPTPDGLNLDYLANGNLTYESESPVSGEPTRYYYDAYHRLAQVWEEPTGTQLFRYVYDALNRRIAKLDIVNGTGSRFVYDGDQIVEVFDVVGTSEGAPREQFFAGAEDRVVAMRPIPTVSTVHYLFHDARGSTVIVADEDGDLHQEVTYGPYGEPELHYPSFAANPFLYMGDYWDPETEFYERRGAIFAPRYGRHVQRFVPK